uniref:CRAL-TRIO domain-containing protein n=2 Tax=Aegilops tauschii TaxID=37682 RepID=A0A453MIA9_AEGTS
KNRPLSAQLTQSRADRAPPLQEMDCGTDEHQHGHGDATEWKKVAELRAVAEAQDPAAKEDDFALRRFLRARDHNIGKASTMLLQYLTWKRVAKPHGSISDDEVRNEIAKDRVRMQGFDRLNRPMAYLYGARHFPAHHDLGEFKRYVAYVLDKICTRLPVGQEKFAAVIDMKGWGYANCDLRGYVAALEIMQGHYPERLGRVFLIHVPYMFMAAWKMVYPFIDDRTRKKFVFVANKDLKSTLQGAIDESQLPEEYGCKLKL